MKKIEHTFVVMAYGESPYLRDCILSLKNQTIKSGILVSTSTPSKYIDDIAAEFELEVNVNNHKPSLCDDWNSALDLAKTQFVTLAHQDDVYGEKYCELILGKMKEANLPIIGFSGSGEIVHSKKVVDTTNLKVKRMLLKPLENSKMSSSVLVKRRCLSLGNSIACPSVCYNLQVVKRPLFEKNFDSNLDWEAWEKLSRLKGSFAYVKEPLVWHRIHESSETSRLIEDDTRNKEDLAMLKKFWPASIAKMIFSQYKKAQKGNVT